MTPEISLVNPDSFAVHILHHWPYWVYRNSHVEIFYMVRYFTGQFWPLTHTLLAFAVLPAVALTIRGIWPEQSDAVVLLRECLMFVAACGLLWSLFRNEKLGWSALGLTKPLLGKTLAIIMIGMILCVIVVAVWDPLMDIMNVPVGGGLNNFPSSLGLLAFITFRAGVLEEFLFRGVAIGRLEKITDNRVIAATLPLLVFTGLHWNSGPRNMLGALALGAVLTWLFLWKRNLWANMSVHFLVDISQIVIQL